MRRVDANLRHGRIIKHGCNVMKPINEEIVRMKNSLEVHTAKLDKLLNSRSQREKMTRIKYVGVPFDPKSYKKGEQEINDALDQGYEVMRDFETGAGIVVCLAKWEKPKNDTDGVRGSVPCNCEECTE